MKNKLLVLFLLFTYMVNSQKLITSHEGKFYVYKEKDKTYTIKDGKKKIKFRGLKYANNAGRGLQILTAENQIKFLDNDKNLSFIHEPQREELYYCGTVQNFATRIIETKDEYLIMKYNYGFSDYKEENVRGELVLEKVSKKNIKDICFVNGEREIRYDENFYFPETVIIEYENGGQGILKSTNVVDKFSEVDYNNPDFIKVKKIDKWGYYTITDCIFDRLDSYNYNLAFFILNDKKGYLDSKGNMYYE